MFRELAIPIEKKIVMNEMQQPVAVQINYQDWLKIEQQLSLESILARRKPLFIFLHGSVT